MPDGTKDKSLASRCRKTWLLCTVSTSSTLPAGLSFSPCVHPTPRLTRSQSSFIALWQPPRSRQRPTPFPWFAFHDSTCNKHIQVFLTPIATTSACYDHGHGCASSHLLIYAIHLRAAKQHACKPILSSRNHEAKEVVQIQSTL